MNIEELMALADTLDKSGQHKEADEIDTLIRKMAEDYDDMSPGQSQPPTSPSQEAVSEEAVVEEAGMTGHEDAPPGMTNLPPMRTPPAVIGAVQYIVDQYEGDRESLLRTLMSQLKLMMEGRQMAPSMASQKSIFEKLADTADHLDEIGEVEAANAIDELIAKHADDYSEDRVEEGDTDQSKRYDDKHHHSLQIREPKKDQERVDREGRDKHHIHNQRSEQKKAEAHALSTRYCPEHQGSQMGRVGEGSYQCPLDGQVYNWETGWTDYDGNQHSGGSVAGQTPDSSGYEIPHRVFDSREKVLNVVN